MRTDSVPVRTGLHHTIHPKKKRGRDHGKYIIHEVTPSVVLMAVKMLIMVWIMNFQVSFLDISDYL